MSGTGWRLSGAGGGAVLFDQLKGLIAADVRSGRLAPGTRLPTVRELAAELGVAVNTAARAYRELEQVGLLETRGRQGTFVTRRDPVDAAMADAAERFAEVARSLAVPVPDAVDYARRALSAGG